PGALLTLLSARRQGQGSLERIQPNKRQRGWALIKSCNSGPKRQQRATRSFKQLAWFHRFFLDDRPVLEDLLPRVGFDVPG
ncbi:MAG: hypothetical protein L7T26_11090, partial [Pseudomonadales bacterium]|nr:hypothetical protein [Pseudomonadales bacterium]